ncbi:MAG: hypothetical protein M1825_006157 [Sarcosagium campestre]|nr:MAG: hypothetical protein M1825_006157 [Sarcosagium campestre]
MEEEVTPTDTQPMLDPRRMGQQNSGLTDHDLSDVICILHPTSNAAIKTVANTARMDPQHILQNEDLYAHRNARGNARHRGHYGADGQLLAAPNVPGAAEIEEAERLIYARPRDLALRLSSRLKDGCAGFKFGRHPLTNDIRIGQDEPLKRVSNNHFRIYVTTEGILMLQDTSTNGTLVDDNLLRCPKALQTTAAQRACDGDSRVLTSSCQITLIAHPDQPDTELKFVVRIPNRGAMEDMFQDNLQQYLAQILLESRRRAAAMEREAAKGAAGARANLKRAGLFGDVIDLTSAGQVAAFPPTTRTTMSPAKQFRRDWDGGEKYHVVNVLGKGAFATVYRIAALMDGTIYAAKELSKRQFMKNHVLDSKFDNEMQIMKRLRHENIVQYIEYEDTAEHMYIIMEYVPHGDLGTLISENGALPELTAKALARQILSALEYLHTRKITHRDIKPDNILVASNIPFVVKLSDFGLSKVIDSQETFLKTFCGTLLYCAPEVFNRYPEYVNDRLKRPRRPMMRSTPHRYNQACDMWSFAAVLFMTLSGSAPYTVETGDKDYMLDKIMTTELDVQPLRLHHVSEHGIDFLRRLLNRRPELRPMETECLSDVWLADKNHHNGVEPEPDPDDLDASQLRLDDGITADGVELQGSDSDSEVQSGGDRVSKRAKTLDDFTFLQQSAFDIPSFSSDAVQGNVADKPNRLFGEISQVALGSSGALPQANSGGNIDLPSAQLHFSENRFDERLPSLGSSTKLKSSDVSGSIESGTHIPSHQMPMAAASLYGAEALVGRLQVASPSDENSPISTPKSPLTPKSREATPAGSLKRIQRPNERPAHSEGETQVKKFSRQIKLEMPDSYYYVANDKSTHNAEYAAKMRALEKSGRKAESRGASVGRALVDEDSVKFIASAKQLVTAEAGKEPEAGEIEPSLQGSAVAVDALAKTSDAQLMRKADKAISSLPVLGRLVTTADSFVSLTVSLTERETTWGRGLANMIRYPDLQDIRVPKYALDILFWRTGLSDVLKTTSNWLDVPEVPVILKTRSSRAIKVNDVPLVFKDDLGNQFGKLYTGDVITIFEDGDEELKFVCEFLRGASARKRSKDEPAFEIEHADFEDKDAISISAPSSKSPVSVGTKI